MEGGLNIGDVQYHNDKIEMWEERRKKYMEIYQKAKAVVVMANQEIWYHKKKVKELQDKK